MVIKKHQSIADFTVQHAGSLEAWWEVAELNGLSITDEVNAGTELLVNVLDATVVNTLQRGGYEVSSNAADVVNGGIGYMQIGNDFKVAP